MYKSRFRIEGQDEVFEGYTDGTLWDGWANVCFTRPQVEKILETLPYDHQFFGKGQTERLIIYRGGRRDETFHSTPLPTDDKRIKRGFFLDGFEFVEVKDE